MLRSIPRFDPGAEYVLAKAKPLGSTRERGEVVSIPEIGERRARQAAEQFLILPTCVQVVGSLSLADGRMLRDGEIVTSDELGAATLKRFLGFRLRPVPMPAAETPATAGKGNQKCRNSK